MRKVRNGPADISKAWLAGWDASLTFSGNPYKRRDYSDAFNRGREAGKRAGTDDVRVLNQMLSRRAAFLHEDQK